MANIEFFLNTDPSYQMLVELENRSYIFFNDIKNEVVIGCKCEDDYKINYIKKEIKTKMCNYIYRYLYKRDYMA